MEKIIKFHQNDKMRKICPKVENALFASKAENVALAQGILGVLGTQNAKMEEITKFREI